MNIQKCILISKNVFLRNSSPKVFNTNFHKLLLQMTHAHVLYIVNNQGEFLVFNVVLFNFALVPLCLYKRVYRRWTFAYCSRCIVPPYCDQMTHFQIILATSDYLSPIVNNVFFVLITAIIFTNQFVFSIFHSTQG